MGDVRDEFGVVRRRPAPNGSRFEVTKSIFYNVCILCGTAVVISLTIKVIMTIF